jgi:hypothetical protein
LRIQRVMISPSFEREAIVTSPWPRSASAGTNIRPCHIV